MKQYRNDKAILLNVPTLLCNEMDELVDEIGMNRTNFIQQSIVRNLSYMNRYELPGIRNRQSKFDELLLLNG
jgi:hypothetical protein